MENFLDWEYFLIFGLYTNCKMTNTSIQDKLGFFALAGTKDNPRDNKMVNIILAKTNTRPVLVKNGTDKNRSTGNSVQLSLF